MYLSGCKLFLDFFTNIEDRKQITIAKIVNLSCPVFIYGNGEYAEAIDQFLEKHDIKVYGRFIDREYHFGDNVFLFDDLEEKFSKFCVVLGMVHSDYGYKKMENRKSPNVLGVFDFFLSPHYLDEIDIYFIKEHEKKLQTVYDNFNDGFSKKVFLSYLKSHVSGSDLFLKEVACGSQYFQDFMPLCEDEVFVDVGAYTGDTLRHFLRVSNRCYNRYYAFEPNKSNFIELTKFIQDKNLPNVFAFQIGLAERNDVRSFSEDLKLSTTSSFSGHSEVTVLVDTIDNKCPDATFIKIDVEGLELEVLRGATKTIETNKPRLAVCIYHRKNHLWDVAFLIRKLNPTYCLYLRQHQTFSTELVLYAC